jgi:hypothetical protein
VATGTVAIHLDDTTTDEELRNLVSWLQDEHRLLLACRDLLAGSE